ncbi:MAG TPA: S-layer homology domain-containing protein, partial [Thermoanaerobaculia bacterium]|nr:S-layer homology domain-containing protein [Thermoanaerobaculia bacterium]
MRSASPAARFCRFLALAAAALATGSAGVLPGDCGPFTDVAADAFCPFVVELFTLGITTGTTPTTYGPSSNVT